MMLFAFLVLVQSFGPSPPLPPLRVMTKQGAVVGKVRGMHSDIQAAVMEYKGMPFAAPPTGDNRFRPPQPPATWQGVRASTEFKSNCVQGSKMGGGTAPSVNEDCLYLNVYTPYNAAAAKTAALPVLFWINGGGWQGGGGDEVQLNGTWDASLMREQLIVVTHNYRLGIFGFLGADELRSRDVVGGSTGNYGIQDQRAAMQWVNANIAAFGGDPKRVFMVGNSAGSAAVSVHLTSKASWPYFSAAGLESGPYYLSPQVSSTTPVWEGLLAYLKCGKTAPVDCVLKQSTASLLAANTYLRANGPCTTGANGERIVGKCGWGGPLIDGVEMKTLVPLAMYQGLMANVPILIGANREDIENTAAATTPSNRKVPPMCNPQTCSEQDFRAWGVGLGFDAATVDAFVQVYSDEENGIPSNVPKEEEGATQWYWARRHAGSDAGEYCAARRVATWMSAKNKAYLYYWAYEADGTTKGAFHSSEVRFVFNVKAPQFGINAQNPNEVLLSDAVVGFWASMATQGNPNNATFVPSTRQPQAHWDNYEPRKGMQNTMVFSNPGKATLMQSVRGKKCDFWDVQFAKLLAPHLLESA